jgi:protein-disulfide isomerase
MMEEQVQVKTDTSKFIVSISRSLMTNAVVALTAFIFGALTISLINTQSTAAHRAEHQALIEASVTTALSEINDAVATNPNNDSLRGITRLDISADDDPFWGNEDAAVTIVEFSDFQCPFCGRFHVETYPRLRETYGDRIRFVYRDFPILSLHPNALISAQAANCANDQGQYWQYHNLLLTNQDRSTRADLGAFAEQLVLDMNVFDDCLDSRRYEQEVNADYRDGASYGVTGTPTFFINGRPLVGAQPYEVFASIIDEELAAVDTQQPS